jgi:hypothetical protein
VLAIKAEGKLMDILMDINAFIGTMPGRALPGWLGYVAALTRKSIRRCTDRADQQFSAAVSS